METPLERALDQMERATVSAQRMRTALRRAAGVIQGLHGMSAKFISGEAIIALATAEQREGESWSDAVARARQHLEAEWPNQVQK